MNNMRKGFTMIELIFVIVIIGILAAVAIPKLAATRDDAEDTKIIANVRICLNDIMTAYTATGVYSENSVACSENGMDIFNSNNTGKVLVKKVLSNGVDEFEVEGIYKGSRVQRQ